MVKSILFSSEHNNLEFLNRFWMLILDRSLWIHIFLHVFPSNRRLPFYDEKGKKKLIFEDVSLLIFVYFLIRKQNKK